jgi:hypothetical protein
MLEDGWLTLDEQTDVLATLRHTLRCTKAAKDDAAEWKFAIVGLHNAFQGAMVCHLSGTAGLGALQKSSIKAALDWHDQDRKGIAGDYPNEKLADAHELFNRLTGVAEARERAGPTLEVSNEDRKAFEKLHELRTGLAHFFPKGWSIEISGIPSMFSRISNIVTSVRHLT